MDTFGSQVNYLAQSKLKKRADALTKRELSFPKRAALLVALVVGVLSVVIALGGCSDEEYRTNPSPTPTPPPRTLVYTDALQQGGPGYVDVYQPVDVGPSPTPSAGGTSVSSGDTSAFVPRPAVIAIHGGLWTAGGRWQLTSLANSLASKGYTVFAPDYSLSPQTEWPAPLLDLQALVRYMRANATTLQIDPQRIGAWGIDAGGQLASMLALRNDPLVAAGTSSSSPPTTLEEVVVTTGRVRGAVAVSAVSDFTIPDGLGPNEDSILRDLFGAPRIQLSQSQLLDGSPVHFVRPDASALIIHGTADSVVSIDNAEHLSTALTDAKADVNLIRVYGGQHDASTYLAPEAWAATLQFIQTRLSGGPTPLSSPTSTSSGK